MEPEFLSTDEALYIHRNQVDTFGGEHGVRDMALLESALAQPQAVFGGSYLHSSLFEMAAAYLYHVVRNHPFIDGNKRTAAMLAMVFLDWNGVTLRPDNEGLVDMTLRVIAGTASKTDAANFLRSLAEG